MATVEENIKVKIDAIINGLPGVQQFSSALKEIKGGSSGHKINIDTAQSEKGVSKLTQFMRALTSSAVIAEGPLGGVAGRLRAVTTEAGELGAIGGPVGIAIGVITLATVGLGVGLLELAKHTATTAEELFRIKETTGLSYEAIATLKVISKETGTELGTLTNTAGRLQVNISKGITEPAGEAGRALKLLKLNNEEFKNSTPDAQLQKTAQALQAVSNQSDKSRASNALLGRGFAESSAALKDIAEKYDEARKKADAFGLVMSEKDVNAAREFGIAVADLSLVVQGFGIQIGERTIPAIEAALDELGRVVGLNENTWKTWGEYIGTVMRGIVIEIAGVAAAMGAMASNAGALWKRNQSTGDSMIEGLSGMDPTTSRFWRFDKDLSNIKEGFKDLTTPIKGESPVDAFYKEIDRVAKLTAEHDTFKPSQPKGGGAPSFPGGKRGGGGKRPRSLPDVAESIFGLDRASAEAAFALFKDAAERQTKALQEQLDKRKISIKQFYADELKIQIDTIDAELKKLGSERIAVNQRLSNKIGEIEADKSITNEEERRRKIEIETNKTAADLITRDERIVVLHRERGQAAKDSGIKEGDAFESLRKQFVQLDEEAASFEGLQSIDAIVEKFRELKKTLQTEIADPKTSDSVRASLQEQLDIVNKLVNATIERTRVENLLAAAAQKNAVIDADIAIIQAKHNGNVIEEYRARLLIKPLLEQQIVNLQAALDAAEKMSESQQDPKTIEALKRQIAAIEEMKRRYKDVGQQIKDTFFNALESGVENLILSFNDVIAGTKSIGQAFKDMAISIIQELEKIIAKMIAMKLIEMALKIFSGGAGDSAGGIGDIGIGAAGGAASGGWFARFAGGGPVSARSGGRPILVGEGGHDEMVVTTDPRHALRSARLLGRFIRRTGILPKFAAGDWISSLSNLGNISFPRMAMGDFVSADGPAFNGETSFTQINNFHLPNVRNSREFQQSRPAIERDLNRAATQGITRLRGSR